MSTDSCIFCKIAEKVLPAKAVYEDDQVLAFHDIHPKAPVHLLLIPKKHIKSLLQLEPSDTALMSHMLLTLPILAKEHGLEEGFRTIVYTGRKGGQEIDHLHFHLLGG
jgi:histidine triad (HIT) family protein